MIWKGKYYNYVEGMSGDCKDKYGKIKKDIRKIEFKKRC